MNLSKLVNPQLMLTFAGRAIGVPGDDLAQLSQRIQGALEPSAGASFQLIPAVSTLMKGDFSPLKSLHAGVLSNPSVRPIAAKMAAEWLQQNDPNGTSVKVLGFISDMPLNHMGRDFTSVESFLDEGLFPLLDEAFTVTNCHCGGELVDVGHNLKHCPVCDLYKDV